MALHLKLRSHHSSLLSVRLLSTSSPFPPPPPSSEDPSHDSQSQQLPSFSSLFKSSPSSRIPLNPPHPPSLSEPSVASSEDIRRHLAEFRLRNPSPRSASSSDISFQKLFKDNNNVPVSDAKRSSFNSFDSIRESLRQSQGRNDQVSLNSLQEKLRSQISSPNSAFGTGDPLPESIFGKDARKLKEEEEDTSSRTFFCRSYSEAELGQKLRQLRPEETEKKQFSLTEMNERLAKLRKMEEESSFSGVIYKDLRGSLMRVLEDDKKKNVQRLSLLANLGGLTTPAFMLKPPQEELLEKYFHPDHMSSAEKMKLELQKVRDEFKMSESDCGSARVQVAQLTTKIKHLSGALHKKDKHSRKGLKEMVQKRKKLLKYLRRTDWDSYCLVLSKLGLRDVPEYKAPDYKSKNKMKA